MKSIFKNLFMVEVTNFSLLTSNNSTSFLLEMYFGNLCVLLLAVSCVLGKPAYSNTNANAESRGQFSANAGVGAGSGNNEGSQYGPFHGKVTGPEAGVGAHAGLHGVGVGFRATAGEVGGQVGGVIGFGGKLGLSADSRVELGENGMEMKVLGTGLSIRPSNGLEICVFGSCFSIG